MQSRLRSICIVSGVEEGSVVLHSGAGVGTLLEVWVEKELQVRVSGAGSPAVSNLETFNLP